MGRATSVRVFFLSKCAAWDVVKAQPAGRKLELATINPSLVQGPMLSSASCASLDLVKQIILGEMPGLVDVYMNTVDVRDVAEAHVRAMINADAAGKRFILGSTEVSPACAEPACRCRCASVAQANLSASLLRLICSLPSSATVVAWGHFPDDQGRVCAARLHQRDLHAASQLARAGHGLVQCRCGAHGS